jgi:choline dehydrogenase
VGGGGGGGAPPRRGPRRGVHDFNGAEQNGADGYPVNVVDGVRQNAALA